MYSDSNLDKIFLNKVNHYEHSFIDEIHKLEVLKYNQKAPLNSKS